jgi:hypothetical protein
MFFWKPVFFFLTKKNLVHACKSEQLTSLPCSSTHSSELLVLRVEIPVATTTMDADGAKLAANSKPTIRFL